MMTYTFFRLVRIWDLKNPTHFYTLEGHNGGIECIQIDTHRDILVSGARDGIIKVGLLCPL